MVFNDDGEEAEAHRVQPAKQLQSLQKPHQVKDLRIQE